CARRDHRRRRHRSDARRDLRPVLHRQMSEREPGTAIRRANEGDIPTLVEHRLALRIESHARSTAEIDAFRSATTAAYRDLVAGGELIAWIAERDGAVIGSVGAFLR